VPEMKIRSAPARAVVLGVVAGFRIVGKAQAHELAKYTQRLPASTGPGRHWTDGSIEFPPGDEVFLRGKQLKAGRRSPWDLGSQILFPDHELRKQLVNSRADGACGKLFFEQSFAGTITSASTVHSGHADLLRHPDPPFLRLPQGILIAEHDRPAALPRRISADCGQDKRAEQVRYSAPRGLGQCPGCTSARKR
jgi:hypothetical protein